MNNLIRKLASINLRLATYNYILQHKDEVYLILEKTPSNSLSTNKANILFISQHTVVFKYIGSSVEIPSSTDNVAIFLLEESSLKNDLIDRLVKSFAYSTSEKEVAEKTIDRIIDMGYRPTIVDSKDNLNKSLIDLIDCLAGALTMLFTDYKQLADSGDTGNWKLEDTVAGFSACKAITEYNEFKSKQLT